MGVDVFLCHPDETGLNQGGFTEMKPFEASRNNLDFLRLLFAVTVIFSHSYALGMGMSSETYSLRASVTYIEPLLCWTHGQTTLGIIAVDGFFIISGFLIANSYLRSRSILTYFMKRVARIYPGFIVCTIIMALVVGPIAGGAFDRENLQARLLSFAGRIVLLKNLDIPHAFERNPLPSVINGSVWTIPWEFRCYIGLAALGLTGLLRRRSVVLVMFGLVVLYFIASGIIVWGHSEGAHWARFFDTNAYVQARSLPGCFLAGVVFFLYRERITHSDRLAFAAICALLISCFVPYSWAFLFPVAGTYIILWFGFHPNIRIHHFARFGDFSYGTYLYAFPVQQLIVHNVGHPTPPIMLFLLATPPSLILGVLSWYGVERWFLSAHRRRGEDAPIVKARRSRERPVLKANV